MAPHSLFSSFDSVPENGVGPGGEAPVAEDNWVEEKMFCHHCDESLAGHRYVLRDDHPYCIKCYENVFANNCDECGKLIGIDSKVRLCRTAVQGRIMTSLFLCT